MWHGAAQHIAWLGERVWSVHAHALRVRKSCPECRVTCPEYCLSLLLCFLCPPATALFPTYLSSCRYSRVTSSDACRLLPGTLESSLPFHLCLPCSPLSSLVCLSSFQPRSSLRECLLCFSPSHHHYYALHPSRPRVTWHAR